MGLSGDKERSREYQRLWWRLRTAKTPSERRRRHDEFRAKYPPRKRYATPNERRKGRNKLHRAWVAIHRDERRRQRRAWMDAHKLLVMKRYGPNGRPECSCCGESQLAFLTLDHIDNDGAVQRRALRVDGTKAPGGDPWYQYLKKKGLPDLRLQTYCWNC